MNEGIVIVDDEVIIAAELQERLSGMGYNVSGIATSGEDAVRMVEDLYPDLVIMDIVMPGVLDGIEAAEYIKATYDVPVVFLTAYADDTIIQRSKRAEPLAYILKPFHSSQIRATIELALHKNKLEKRLKESEVSLRRTKSELEKRVRERTMELERKTLTLEETNTTLRVLLDKGERDKDEIEQKVMANVQDLILPYIEKLKRVTTDERARSYLEIIENNLADIISPFLQKISSDFKALTPTELKVAHLVKQGKTAKEIATLLNMSSRTIETYRSSIRKKMGISDRRANLRALLDEV